MRYLFFVNINMNYKQKVGKFGEDLASDYLIRHGYKIIGRNVKISYKEIDIIAKYSKIIVFIEVKTRMSSILGSANDAFSQKKMNTLKKALAYYIYDKNVNENYVRLDLIAIDINRKNKIAKIKHYNDVI